jgi:hypothetical protein
MKLKIESKDIDATSLIAVGQEKDKTFCVISPELTYNTAIQLLHTISLHILNAYTIAANGGPLSDKPTKAEMDKFIAIKSQIYDQYNLAASSILETYAPEFELRPDVTTEAIQREENKVISERYKALPKQLKAAAKKRQQKLKEQLLKDKYARDTGLVKDEVSKM